MIFVIDMNYEYYTTLPISGYYHYIYYLPKLDLVLDRSIIACLLGLFNTERLASEMSAVTRVIDIL